MKQEMHKLDNGDTRTNNQKDMMFYITAACDTVNNQPGLIKMSMQISGPGSNACCVEAVATLKKSPLLLQLKLGA